MDERLVEAARVGDVMALNRIMEQDPDILERACSVHGADSPLHVAAGRGKAEFVKQIVTRLPSLARETNEQGMIPLHLASLIGHVETVRELLNAKLDDEVNQCLLKDEKGWTPLHWASKRGKISVIQVLIIACPQCLKQVTEKGETILHVAVNANQFEAVKVLADSIKRLNFHNLLKEKDQKGKSAYQLAAAMELPPQGERNKDSKRKSTQDAILVVATLIITLTYQALASPPTTLFKDGSTKIDWRCLFSKKISQYSLANQLKECPALLSYAFLMFNTTIFLLSIYMAVLALRGNCLLKTISHVAQWLMVCLILCYSVLLTAISYNIVYFSLPLAIIVVSASCWFLRKQWASLIKRILATTTKMASKLKRIDSTRCPATSAT